jgi:hypothetical protein
MPPLCRLSSSLRDPAGTPGRVFLFSSSILPERRLEIAVGSAVQARRKKMKHVLSACTAFFLLTAAAGAAEVAAPSGQADKPAEDCSKQVWPQFSPSCLRNVDQAVAVRLIAVSRR